MEKMGLIRKLLIKKGYRVAVLNAPEGFALPAEEFPEEIEITKQLTGKIDCILLFALNQNQLKAYTPDVIPHLEGDTLFWAAYPKKSAKLKTDISRDEGWEVLKEAGYQGVSLISIDETWSAFRIRNQQYIKRS
jgi:hypothetical protein